MDCCATLFAIVIGLALWALAMYALLLALYFVFLMVPIVLPFATMALGAEIGGDVGGAAGFVTGLIISAAMWRPWYDWLGRMSNRRSGTPSARTPRWQQDNSDDPAEYWQRESPEDFWDEDDGEVILHPSGANPHRPRIAPAGTRGASSAKGADYLGATCPYCQSGFLPHEDVLVCRACEIPHHRECWQENGGCTTYGCENGPG